MATFGLRVKLPPVYHTREGFTLFLFVTERQSRKLLMPMLIDFGSNRPARPQRGGGKRGRRPHPKKNFALLNLPARPPQKKKNCPFPCGNFFFFEIAENLKLSRPIWRDDLFFVLVFGDQHQLAQFCGPSCKKICPSPPRTMLQLRHCRPGIEAEFTNVATITIAELCFLALISQNFLSFI